MNVDIDRLNDLVEFARIEAASRDVEPWADILARVALPRDDRTWLMTLYNTYDDLHSAFACYRRWPSIAAWAAAGDRDDVAQYNCTQERRNLRGGRVIKRFASYAAVLAGRTEEKWMREVCQWDNPGRNFTALSARMREVWGVGRQSAFEWAEFAGKVVNLPVDAADGQLFESSGPRRCLERIFCLNRPTPAELDHAANVCREWIAQAGVPLAWVDFETIICDYNVMRDGRYYPGRHLAALREEIDTLPSESDRALLNDAWARFVPEPWASIAPGIDPAKMPVYRNTGRMLTCP
ncbi:hypothetical protein I5G59_gp03 [Mycobacterium phage LilMcDreamy]|uniref:Amino acid:DNA transferase domain-containing protein n=1 Tax=Mycobacterium phage LilMcDreamy TaxID=2652422 RepID=A0A5P8D6E5_9CAUD|nr:hypothetical protein I5G59_gp03 [Mycobacterium phage LilMcDreamy]QFP94623.1 hypothetical protein SEA_LILMCDREAMY_3 [Mycobacterium phage LilMcDreamy]